jgi:WhiB family transcriptional regulator, redox-sensing transcriptional regulator
MRAPNQEPCRRRRPGRTGPATSPGLSRTRHCLRSRSWARGRPPNCRVRCSAPDPGSCDRVINAATSWGPDFLCPVPSRGDGTTDNGGAMSEFRQVIPVSRPPVVTWPASSRSVSVPAHSRSAPEALLSSQLTQASAAWMPRSACQGEDPEIFFPMAATGRALDQISAAKAICSRCPVRQPCLRYAVATIQDGIWGGTTTDERSGLRGPSRPNGPAALERSW